MSVVFTPLAVSGVFCLYVCLFCFLFFVCLFFVVFCFVLFLTHYGKETEDCMSSVGPVSIRVRSDCSFGYSCVCCMSVMFTLLAASGVFCFLFYRLFCCCFFVFLFFCFCFKLAYALW